MQPPFYLSFRKFIRVCACMCVGGRGGEAYVDFWPRWRRQQSDLKNVQMLMFFFVLFFLFFFPMTRNIANKGFTTSASLTIATGQLHKLFGVKNSKRSFVVEVHDTFANLPKAHWPDIVMSVMCITLTIALSKLKARMDKKPDRSLAQNIAWFTGTAGNFVTIAFGMIIGFSWFQGSPDDICGTKYDHWKNGSHWYERRYPTGISSNLERCPPSLPPSGVAARSGS